MAYPFFQAPTVEEFVQGLVDKYGCVRHTLENVARGPHGLVTIDYLSRELEGAELVSEPLPRNLRERLSPDSARRLIVQLKLPPEAWLWAGSAYEMPDDDWPEHDEDDNDE